MKYDKKYFEGGKGTVFKDYTFNNYFKDTQFNWDIIQHYFPRQPFLDFGCGKGFLVEYADSLKLTCHGIDLSKYAHTKSNPIVKERLSVGDVGSLTDPVYSGLKLLVSFFTLEHLSKSDIVKFLTTAKKQFPNLLFRIPIRPSYVSQEEWYKEWEDDATHQSMMTFDWWQKTLADNGWIAYKADLDDTCGGYFRGTFVCCRDDDWFGLGYKERFNGKFN